MARFTIKFRGKLTDSGSVKMPSIKPHHTDLVGNEDIATTLFFGCRDEQVTRSRLANMIGAETGDYYWPSYAETDLGFTIEPIGNGFMANVSISLDTSNMRRKTRA